MVKLKYLIFTISIFSFIYSLGNYSILFDNDNDYIDLGRPVSAYSNDNITISTWINTVENYYPNNGHTGIFLSNDTTPDNPQISLWMHDNGTINIRGNFSLPISSAKVNICLVLYTLIMS